MSWRFPPNSLGRLLEHRRQKRIDSQVLGHLDSSRLGLRERINILASSHLRLCTVRRLVRGLTMTNSSDGEAMLSRYFHDYVADGRRPVYYIVEHPRQSVAALIYAFQLPTLNAYLTESPDGKAIRNGLSRRSVLGRTVNHRLTAVLTMPIGAEEYTAGASKQTLRRKVRKALALGVHWVRIDDPMLRRQLLQLANENERSFPREEYRRSDPDNSDLLGCQLWLAAYSKEGRPVLLSITPVDGEWALLGYFRILGIGQEQTNARYLMTQVLVQQLVGLGVRYLADPGSPVGLPNGLREYQRILGFRIVQVRPVNRSSPRSLPPFREHQTDRTADRQDTTAEPGCTA